MQLDARRTSDGSNRLSLLWVDDDALLRKTIKLVATGMTRRLELAASTAEARAILESGARFDWIVCDYHLCGSTSTEFVHELTAAGHRVAVLTGDPERVDRSLDVRIFEKPILLQDLIEELWEAGHASAR